MRRLPRTTRRGLTLLEVIVAMTVLAVGITAMLGAVSSCLRSSAAAADYTRGALLAQQVAAEYERMATLDIGEQHGAFLDLATGTDLAPGYAWVTTVDAADDEGLYPVQITVTWANGARQYRLATRLRPHELPAAEAAGDRPPAGSGAGSNTGTSEVTVPPGGGGAGGRP